MTEEDRGGRLGLIIAAAVTIVIWQLPYGRQILYPFSLLATFAHEMGHGLTALLMGADFSHLELYSDGSGLAHWSGSVGRIARGLIAAGGLVGPSIAGALVLIGARKTRGARVLLSALGIATIAAVIFFVRNIFGMVFLLAAGALAIGLARFLPERLASFSTKFLGVQLCLALFQDVSYMFSEGGVVDGVMRRSDSAAIAEALFLPYWFWGALSAAFAVLVLALGLWLSLRTPRRKEVTS